MSLRSRWQFRFRSPENVIAEIKGRERPGEVVLLGGGNTPDLAWLQEFERDWLAPAWAQWRAGRRELTA